MIGVHPGVGPDALSWWSLYTLHFLRGHIVGRQYVLPALFLASGRPPRGVETALLAERVDFEPSLTCFLPVRLRATAIGNIAAKPVPTNTSGDFASLSGTDGYVELDKETSTFPADTPVPLHRWSSP